ncbi:MULTISPECIES: ABC transporter ATP-binding protein [Tenacibaculum]|uniref:ABC transporter ATP-binding protein n=1 Tax=Tenacibaculum TaxID=104267 RepID=UPI0008944722|nr:ABC transporter ATP-binding protein [Tenacibaculum sp. MAR_2010_89]SEE47480.1 ATP-binding cassette, subfamily B, MsbA [Tenacibaculum sp. MAR_2010_89]
MNDLKKVIRFIFPYKRLLILNIICNVFYALFSTLSFVAFIPMLDILFKSNKRVYVKPVYEGLTNNFKLYLENSLNYFVTQQIENGNNGEIVVLGYVCIIIIFLFLLKNIANYASLYFMAIIRNGVIKDMRNEVYLKVISLPISFFTEKRKGDVMSRITNDVGEVQWSFLSVLEMLVKQPLIIIFTLSMMFAISPQLTLFIFIFIPLSGLIIAFIGKKLRASSDQVQRENGQFLSHVEETLSGLKIIKGFVAESIFKNRFFKTSDKIFKHSNKLMFRQNLATPLSEVLGITVIVVVLWYGGKMVLIDKSMTGGTFIGFMALAYNILTPAKNISNAMYSIKRAGASIDRILEILNKKNPITDKKDAITKDDFNSEIKIDNISFKYKNDYVLKDFSLTIPKGKTVALVGQSGSGKSTLTNIIPRFYDIDKGSITVDGLNIKDVTKNSLRSLIGIVTQDSILFNDSVANNISLGSPDATPEEIQKASKIANAHEFIKDLPEQYNTNIGDGGGNLSGGQKQRLSIARAVLKNPPIMILDEATSALDTESEKLVQDDLDNMMKNRTSIVVAHRLSTIQNADLIVVMKKGKIMEQGNHEELLAKKGEYFKLITMQSFQ